ncbi:helix-turn-helix domain-containing protein [Succinivibrio sp.]
MIPTFLTRANISTDCGFNNQSYFSRAFTKHFKMSPAEYRNKH